MKIVIAIMSVLATHSLVSSHPSGGLSLGLSLPIGSSCESNSFLNLFSISTIKSYINLYSGCEESSTTCKENEIWLGEKLCNKLNINEYSSIKPNTCCDFTTLCCKYPKLISELKNLIENSSQDPNKSEEVCVPVETSSQETKVPNKSEEVCVPVETSSQETKVPNKSEEVCVPVKTSSPETKVPNKSEEVCVPVKTSSLETKVPNKSEEVCVPVKTSSEETEDPIYVNPTKGNTCSC